MKISIRSKPSEVGPFVETIQRKADAERHALGFLPNSVYREAAEQQKLFVAVASSDELEIYAGHILFGGTYPHSRIFQIFTDPPFRGKGVARRMMQAIVRKVQAAQYLSIIAKVADDLTAANEFWERMNFRLVRSKIGGKSSRRLINLRVRDLDTPSLLNLLDVSTERDEPDLRLVERFSVLSPVYLIDLNVLFDVVKRRLRTKEARRVIRAGFENRIRLAVTEEFISELERNSDPSSADPLLELALELPRLPNPPRQEITETLRSLGSTIFPERVAKGRLSPQDQSDIMHLAAAIFHDTAGFVTSEKAILRAHDLLQANYSIDVVGVGEFAELLSSEHSTQGSTILASLRGVQIRASSLTAGGQQAALDFLERMYVPPQLRSDAISAESLAAGRQRVLVADSKDETLAYACWNASPGPQRVVDVFVCCDEDHPAAETATDYLFERICRESCQSGPALVRLRELPGHALTRRVALFHGFRPALGHSQYNSSLHKVCVGRPVVATYWPTLRKQLKSLSGIGLPSKFPRFDGCQQLLEIESPSGTTVAVTLKDLENLLSPVLFLFPKRDGVILPIRRGFAEDLFGASAQLSLLASPEAVLLKERVYFKSPKSASLLEEGVPLLFYESGKGGGRKSVIAAARVVRSQILLKGDIASDVKRRGVLTEPTLERLTVSEKVLAIRFDNIMIFRTPVGLARMREIGCIDRSNLVTARRVSAQNLVRVLEDGQANG